MSISWGNPYTLFNHTETHFRCIYYESALPLRTPLPNPNPRSDIPPSSSPPSSPPSTPLPFYTWKSHPSLPLFYSLRWWWFACLGRVSGGWWSWMVGGRGGEGRGGGRLAGGGKEKYHVFRRHAGSSVDLHFMHSAASLKALLSVAPGTVL